MPLLDLGEVQLNWREDGDPSGRPLVLLHALGADLTLWDRVVPLLPQTMRILRLDMRGHGGSSVPPGPYAMGALIRDAERAMEQWGARDAVVAGLSIGGLIAQGLAVKRLDLVRALVLSNTATKIATPAVWAERIATIEAGGMDAIAQPVIERWFPRAARSGPDATAWRDRLMHCNPAGYAGAAAAIGGTDFLTPSSGLRLPALVIAGSEDGSTPPDLVRELAELIPGARFALLRRTGHVPPVDAPEAWAAAVTDFLAGIGEAPVPHAHDHDHAHHGPGCCGHDH
ncbi:3-oxoadipate enol-lactonase [Frigidibacter sp. MR17.14]|uniref:3-oxoadipate enol-lactonase n=1 Tax=Frigidibacter sp. MR17.14 TaxID=3126509 RepID=UPI003012CB18